MRLRKLTAIYRNLKLFTLFLAIWPFAGCERSTHVKVEGGTTPVFSFSGSGNLANFEVYLLPESYENETEPFWTRPAAWRIDAQEGYLRGRTLEEIGKITYGVVPVGYKQVKPENNQPPPPILPSRIYRASCDTTNAPHGGVTFQIKEGKARIVDLELPCFTQQDGKWTKVPCVR
jgi:hypothetical protein